MDSDDLGGGLHPFGKHAGTKHECFFEVVPESLEGGGDIIMRCSCGAESKDIPILDKKFLDQFDLVERAYDFAKLKHDGQLDDIGLPYFQHVLQVYSILKSVTADAEILAAALLHDTIEDTNTTLEELTEQFGARVAQLVNEVTHDGQKDQKGYYFPRLQSRDAILIKFADRLSNLSRMQNWDIARQEHYLKKSKFWKSE